MNGIPPFLEQFLDAWNLVQDKVIQNPDWSDLIQDPISWTQYMLKVIPSILSGELGLRYYSEFRGVDLALAHNNNNFQPQTLQGGGAVSVLKNQEHFYPSESLILLEHENKISKCWEEMIALSRFRASLKVLVTYNWAITSENDYDNFLAIARENFSGIIKQTNILHPENAETAYLLIVGQRDSTKSLQVLNWHRHWFDVSGQSCEV